jgi:hypothetical protein
MGCDYTIMPQREGEPGMTLFKGCGNLFGEKRLACGFCRTKHIFLAEKYIVRHPFYEKNPAKLRYRRSSCSTAIDDPLPCLGAFIGF